MLTLFINIFLKIFIIFTPFFVMSAFLSLTKDESQAERQRIAVKVTLAITLTCFALFLFGAYIFALFGITLDAFRIGAGAVLFLSGVSMIQGKATVSPQDSKEDVAVVPLAIDRSLRLGHCRTDFLYRAQELPGLGSTGTFSVNAGLWLHPLSPTGCRPLVPACQAI